MTFIGAEDEDEEKHNEEKERFELEKVNESEHVEDR
jgi:hypothetical protein